MASSYSSPSSARLHDNLMELYTNSPSSNRQQQQLSSSSNNNIQGNSASTQQKHIFISSSLSTTDRGKKKRTARPNRKFLPMVSKLQKDVYSSSDDSDEEYTDKRQQVDNHFTKQSSSYYSEAYIFQSPLGQRISKQYHLQLNLQNKSNPKEFIQHDMPSKDFLRLPPTLVKVKEGWVDIRELEHQMLQYYLDNETPLMHNETSRQIQCKTSVVRERDVKVGFGMSLREYDGSVYVQAVLRRNGTKITDFDNHVKDGGPAYLAGLRPGDRLFGLNGLPLLKSNSTMKSLQGESYSTIPINASSESVLQTVGDAISRSSIPLIVHYQRGQSVRQNTENIQPRPSDSGGSENSKQPQTSNPTNASPSKPKGPYIHPFAKILSKRSIIQHGQEEKVITQQMRVLCDRTRQWESKLSFRLRASDYKLRPQLDPRDVEPTYYASFVTDDGEAPPFFSYKYAKNVRSYTPSTPMIQDWRLSREGEEFTSPIKHSSHRMTREAAVLADLYAGLNEDDVSVQDLFLGGRVASNITNARQGGSGVAYPGAERYLESADRDMTNDVIVPLVRVRKAICVRILNSFLDNRNRAAFSIWCYDVESGIEWYAPVRYHDDFKDLRLALIRIDKSIGDIPFPSFKWGDFGLSIIDAKDSADSRELRRDQLECFLRRVFAEIYRGKLHPHLAEVAIHLQTFVGCDGVISDDNGSSLALNHQVAITEATYGKRSPDETSESDIATRTHLKRSIQRYVYRIFLLPCIERLITQFIAATKQTSNSQTQPTADETSALDIEKIRDFIDQVQELILEGCYDDLTSISQRRDFAAINDFSNIDDLLREAVREQIELEIYVPLRRTISNHLVRTFFNSDVEMKYKMKALENKPQSFFRIQPEHRSRSDWKSVSNILREGVGRSTLPSVKLRAIVDAAKEITQLYSEERGCFKETSFFDGPIQTKTLGADDFLPIFIFCFLRAKLERPYALCELLQTMCDPYKLNGETGYYLASFHAAMTHINELDLTEANDELSIFLDALP